MLRVHNSFVIISISLAKRIIKIIYPSIFILALSHISFVFTTIIIFSIKQLNKGGDKIHPCHTSFLIFALADASLFLISAFVYCLYSVCIIFKSRCSILNSCYERNIIFQLTLSNAISKPVNVKWDFIYYDLFSNVLKKFQDCSFHLFIF